MALISIDLCLVGELILVHEEAWRIAFTLSVFVGIVAILAFPIWQWNGLRNDYGNRKLI